MSDSDRTAETKPGLDWWLFLTKFLQRGRVIASFAPSSRFMARAILRGIDFDKNPTIVELGAGTGPITAELLKRNGTKGRVIINELDPDLCRHLRRRFPQADIIEGDAADLERLLEERGIRQVDHILSGLPLPSIPEEIRDRILEISARRLAPGGTFRQLTVMPWVYYPLYKRYFDDVHFRFVFRNLPPGGVYFCTGYQPRP
ncbi:MAG: class I SAM-dependent methyltransferase [Gemmataceae bacterium]